MSGCGFLVCGWMWVHSSILLCQYECATFSFECMHV